MDGVAMMEIKSGAFKSEDARDWMICLLTVFKARGNQLNNLVVVCDNAPYCTGFKTAIESDIEGGSCATFLQLESYTPELNPLENVWSKIKANVKSQLVLYTPADVGLECLNDAILSAKNTISSEDCARAIYQSTRSFEQVLRQEDINVKL